MLTVPVRVAGARGAVRVVSIEQRGGGAVLVRYAVQGGLPAVGSRRLQLRARRRVRCSHNSVTTAHVRVQVHALLCDSVHVLVLRMLYSTHLVCCPCRRFMAEFLGIVAGHLYYFLKFTYPQEHGGPQLLNTPEFLCATHHFVVTPTRTRSRSILDSY